MRWRVSSAQVDVERHEVALGRSSASSGRYVAPSGIVTSSGTGWTSWYRISIPKPWARRATAWPIRPNPTIPIVAPWTSGPSSSSGPQVFQRPSRTYRSPSGSAAGRGHQQRPGEVGGRLGQDARRVADRDAAPRAGGDVDVVEADRVVAHDPQPGPGRVEELVVDPVGQQRQHAVAAGDPTQQLVARRRQVVLPDVGVAAGADRVEPLVGDDPRDEDPRAARSYAGPPRAARRGRGSARAPR